MKSKLLIEISDLATSPDIDKKKKKLQLQLNNHGCRTDKYQQTFFPFARVKEKMWAMSKCGSLTYTLLQIKEGRDGSKPQYQLGKQITRDPPEHSNKSLVKMHLK